MSYLLSLHLFKKNSFRDSKIPLSAFRNSASIFVQILSFVLSKLGNTIWLFHSFPFRFPFFGFTRLYTQKKAELALFRITFFCFFRSAVQFFTIPRLFFLEFLPKLDRPLQTVPVYETSCCVPSTTFPLGSCLFPLPPSVNQERKRKITLRTALQNGSWSAKPRLHKPCFPLPSPSLLPRAPSRQRRFARNILEELCRQLFEPLLHLYYWIIILSCRRKFILFHWAYVCKGFDLRQENYICCS